MKPIHLAALVLLAALPPLVAAQTTKPGLWEMTNKIGGNARMDAAMAQMQQQMASMSPAQRKQMQDMLARQGMSMPGTAPGGGMSMKVCITPEMAARNEAPPVAEGDCQHEVVSRSAQAMKIRFTCAKPPSSGEGTVSFQGDSGYTTVMDVTTQVDGKPEKMRVEGQGRWLAASCGGVKPLGK